MRFVAGLDMEAMTLLGLSLFTKSPILPGGDWAVCCCPMLMLEAENILVLMYKGIYSL